MKLSQQLEIKSLNADTGQFSGLAWAYDQTDRTGDRIIKGAFNSSIERLKAAGNALPLLWNHDQSQPIGSLVLEDTDAGLMVHGKLELTLEKAREAYQLLKQRVLSLSIGFMFDDQHAEIANGVREFREVDLFETSLVTVPANAGSTITTVKSFADCETKRDFETLVRDALGLSRRQAKTLASVGFTALKDECDAQDQSDELQQQQLEILKALDCATASIIRGNTQ